MTAERDGKGRRAGRPDLLASLPAEGPPASQPASGIDPAAIEELLTGVRDLRKQVAGLREAMSADRPAPEPAGVSEALTLEALEAWGDNLVARVAEAARPADAPAAAPDEDAAAALADHTVRIEEAAAKATAAAERIDRGLDNTADRVATEVGEAVTRMEKGLGLTRNHVDRVSRLAHGALQDIETRVVGQRFSRGAVFAWLIVFVFGMLIESRAHIFYGWFWAD